MLHQHIDTPYAGIEAGNKATTEIMVMIR